MKTKKNLKLKMTFITMLVFIVFLSSNVTANYMNNNTVAISNENTRTVLNFSTQKEADAYLLANGLSDDNLLFELTYSTRTRAVGRLQAFISFLNEHDFNITCINIGTGTVTDLVVSTMAYRQGLIWYASSQRNFGTFNPGKLLVEDYHYPGAYIVKVEAHMSFFVDGVHYADDGEQYNY